MAIHHVFHSQLPRFSKQWDDFTGAVDDSRGIADVGTAPPAAAISDTVPDLAATAAPIPVAAADPRTVLTSAEPPPPVTPQTVQLIIPWPMPLVFPALLFRG